MKNTFVKAWKALCIPPILSWTSWKQKTSLPPGERLPIRDRSGLWQGLTMSAILLVTHAAPALDLKPTSKELRAERQWLKEHLLDCKLPTGQAEPVDLSPLPTEPGLDVFANNDPVIQNGRGTHRMRIGDKEYSRGLYCHAVSKVEVHLPGPGKQFTAVVGLDHNDDTARGKGSVVFTVTIKDKVAFRSDVMRYGTPASEVNVDLGGADAFTLEIGAAGDGIGWDQSDWAEAKVTLADSRELWLGEMPPRTRSADHWPGPDSQLPLETLCRSPHI